MRKVGGWIFMTQLSNFSPFCFYCHNKIVFTFQIALWNIDEMNFKCVIRGCCLLSILRRKSAISVALESPEENHLAAEALSLGIPLDCWISPVFAHSRHRWPCRQVRLKAGVIEFPSFMASCCRSSGGLQLIFYRVMSERIEKASVILKSWTSLWHKFGTFDRF